MSKIKAGSRSQLLCKVKSAACTCRSCGGSKKHLKSRIRIASRESDRLSILEQLEYLYETALS